MRWAYRDAEGRLLGYTERFDLASSSQRAAARSSFPALNNAQNPISYGADPTGANDSTAAFQNAVDAGDLYITCPAGMSCKGAFSFSWVVPRT
jgi:hypothetical protein